MIFIVSFIVFAIISYFVPKLFQYGFLGPLLGFIFGGFFYSMAALFTPMTLSFAGFFGTIFVTTCVINAIMFFGGE